MKDGEGELDRSEGNGAMFNAEEAYQGKVKGLIQPPPDIRAVADKTARFVAKNGKGFEQRILASEEGQSSKFNFMRPHDPYYAYYEAKIREFEEVPDGQPTPAAPSAPAPAATSEPSGATESRQDEVAPAKAAVQRKAVSDPIAKVAKTLDREKEPAAFVFSSIRPTGLTALDIDMIKLTAQYTAAGGRNFLSVLAKREADNEQYQFLKSTHALFSYFTTLVDEYSMVLQPTPETLELVNEGIDRRKILERVVHRWEYERAQEEKRASEAEANLDPLKFSNVDWYDFVVVETITFGKDELLELAQVTEEDMDVDMDMEEELNEPPKPALPIEEDGIKVVMDYQPQVVRPKASEALPQMVMDPISGRLVDAKDLSEHMRVQLLDPKWREQQARALEKQKDTPFAAGESIANSLQAFARKRTDIFGSAEEEEARLAREAELRRKTLEQDNQSRWDGMDSPPGNGAPPISQSFSANALPPPPAAPVAPPAAAAPVPPPLPPLPPPPPSFLPPHASGAIPPSASIPAATAAPPQPPPAFEEVQQTPEEWAALNPGPIYLTVNCADDSSVVEAWGLKGQSLTVELPGAMSLVKDLKIKLQEMLGGMPPNKQMLKASVGFLKDSQSLAFYQLATGATIDLLPRKRGGK